MLSTTIKKQFESEEATISQNCIDTRYFFAAIGGSGWDTLPIAGSKTIPLKINILWSGRTLRRR